MAEDAADIPDPEDDSGLEDFEIVERVNWDPLDSQHEFRLLLLAARSEGEDLKATMRFLTFETAPKYIALSYRWGTSFTKSIVCNGRPFPITDNLHSALCRLRLADRGLNIWCDAICVRQGADDITVDEHAKQIPMMKHIYTNAVKVIIDLGDDDGTLSKCLEGINAILECPQDLRKQARFQADVASYLDLPPFTDPIWSALEALLSRPWFLRMWCVQEAVLAQDISVIFGPHAVSWDQLISASAIYSLVCQNAARVHQTKTWDISAFNIPIFASQALVTKWQMRNARLKGDKAAQLTLTQLLIMTMGHRATDQRDRVYGLYGMLPPGFENQFPVSYTESLDDFGYRLSEFLLRSGSGTWMLVYCGGINGNSRATWSIDPKALGEMLQADPLHSLTQHDGSNHLYKAGGTLKADLRLEQGHLIAQGVIVDFIEAVPESIARPSESQALVNFIDIDKKPQVTPKLTSSVIRWFRTIVQWGGQSEALWRTLIADFDPHLDDEHREINGRPKAEFGRYFDLLLDYARSVADVDFSNMAIDDFETHYPVPAGAVKFWTAASTPLVIRRFIKTEAGRFGIVPLECRAGDAVAVLHGVPVPIILRADGEKYQVIGTCYVHGIMQGETVQHTGGFLGKFRKNKNAQKLVLK